MLAAQCRPRISSCQCPLPGMQCCRPLDTQPSSRCPVGADARCCSGCSSVCNKWPVCLFRHLGPFVTLSDSTINESDSPKVLRRKRQETQIVCSGTTLLSKTLGQEKRDFFSNNAAGETDSKKNSNSTVKPFTTKIIMIPIYTLILLLSLLTL